MSHVTTYVATYAKPWFERTGEKWWPVDAEVGGRDHTESWFRGNGFLSLGVLKGGIVFCSWYIWIILKSLLLAWGEGGRGGQGGGGSAGPCAGAPRP